MPGNPSSLPSCFTCFSFVCSASSEASGDSAPEGTEELLVIDGTAKGVLAAFLEFDDDTVVIEALPTENREISTFCANSKPERVLAIYCGRTNRPNLLRPQQTGYSTMLTMSQLRTGASPYAPKSRGNTVLRKGEKIPMAFLMLTRRFWILQSLPQGHDWRVQSRVIQEEKPQCTGGGPLARRAEIAQWPLGAWCQQRVRRADALGKS